MDEIVLSAADGPGLCHSRTCTSLGRPAEVVVTFGRLGTAWPDALWPECWGRSYWNCAGCWDQTRQVVLEHRPGVMVRDRRPAAPPGPPDAGRGGV